MPVVRTAHARAGIQNGEGGYGYYGGASFAEIESLWKRLPIRELTEVDDQTSPVQCLRMPLRALALSRYIYMSKMTPEKVLTVITRAESMPQYWSMGFQPGIPFISSMTRSPDGHLVQICGHMEIGRNDGSNYSMSKCPVLVSGESEAIDIELPTCKSASGEQTIKNFVYENILFQ